MNGHHSAIPALGLKLGHVIGGSLKEGVAVKLDPGVSVESISVGTYVTIAGEGRTYFCLITNLRLDALDTRALVNPPDIDDPLIRQIWAGTGIYGVVEVRPELVVDPLSTDEPRAVKSLPGHFAAARAATAEEFERIFGSDDSTHFVIGSPIDMDLDLCLDLRRLAERSVGVFGKSGTGKSFLTRLLLAGLIQKQAAATLTFDMHNDHGYESKDETGKVVDGLRKLYGPKVSILTLDRESSYRRQVPFDHEIAIGYDQIEPQDIVLLAESLDISSPQIDALYAVYGKYKREWFAKLLDADTNEKRQDLLSEVNAHQQALDALCRKLNKLARYGFLRRDKPADYFDYLLTNLERRNHIVLEFGNYNDPTAYVLVANLITRRIHDLWRRRKEEAFGDSAKEPPQLVIAIEEAHKFLSPKIASDTIFGEIAREMRKYNVTLLVVDQRPSAIDDEVMSQIGTRISCLLDNEKDVDAVLSGTSGKSELKTVLARLETKQQALVIGHAVPMPVVIRTRDYGAPETYRALRQFELAATLQIDPTAVDADAQRAERRRRLFGDD